MLPLQSPRFDDFGRDFDAVIRAVHTELEESGVSIADWSNRQPHYDPLRTICYTFTKRHSAKGEQQKVSVAVSVVEPVAEDEPLTVVLTTKAERFWIGRASHWQSSYERLFTTAEVLECDFAGLVRQCITDGQAEITQST